MAVVSIANLFSVLCGDSPPTPRPSIVSNTHKTLSQTMAFGVWDLSRGKRDCVTLRVRRRRSRGRTQRWRETRATGIWV